MFFWVIFAFCIVSKSYGRIAGCIQSCSGLIDGYYASCISCDVYAACAGGIFYDNMRCPSNLKWDDSLKRCEYNSGCSDEDDHECVDDCSDQEDGNYQSCDSCNNFVTCSNCLMYRMNCPAGLVWDDVLKRCEWSSSTCE